MDTFNDDENKSDQELADSLQQTTDDIKNTARKYGDVAQDYYQDIKQNTQQGVKKVRDKLTETSQLADKKVRDNPWGAVGVAALAGLAVGIIMGMCKRKPRNAER